MSITFPDLKDQTSHPKIYFKDNFTIFLLPKYAFEALLQPLRKRSSEYHFHKIELFFIFLPYKSIETSYDPESSLNRFLWCFYTGPIPKKRSSNDLPPFFRDKKTHHDDFKKAFFDVSKWCKFWVFKNQCFLHFPDPWLFWRVWWSRKWCQSLPLI